MHQVFLGIGGNIGNKALNFKKVYVLIEKKLGKIIAGSSVYETSPWGFDAENNFWNQALLIETSLAPEDLLNHIHQIENEFGRIRKEGKYLSREMDIDVLFYNDLVLSTQCLTIPHPHIEKRLFVLAPLNDIAPGFVHPILKKSIRELLEQCVDNSYIEKIDPNEEQKESTGN